MDVFTLALFNLDQNSNGSTRFSATARREPAPSRTGGDRRLSACERGPVYRVESGRGRTEGEKEGRRDYVAAEAKAKAAKSFRGPWYSLLVRASERRERDADDVLAITARARNQVTTTTG